MRGWVIAALLVAAPNTALGSTLTENVREIRHRDAVLHFLNAVAVKDVDVFDRLVSSSAEYEGVDSDAFKRVSMPLTIDNAGQMLELCILGNIGYATTAGGRSRTNVSWRCGPEQTKFSMYIDFSSGKVVRVNAFAPLPIALPEPRGN